MSYNFALKTLPASRASLFVNIVPLVTVLTSWLLLDERLLPGQLGGGLLVIVAACLTGEREELPLEEGVELSRV